MVQSQVVSIFPTELFADSSCIQFEQNSDKFKTTFQNFSGDEQGLIEIQEEEKEESEHESLLFYLEAHIFKTSRLFTKVGQLGLFDTKAVSGSLHLYDLFHNWKVFVS